MLLDFSVFLCQLPRFLILSSSLACDMQHLCPLALDLFDGLSDFALVTICLNPVFVDCHEHKALGRQVQKNKQVILM